MGFVVVRVLKGEELRREAREQVSNTSDMDWEAWGDTPGRAAREFGNAVKLAWPGAIAKTKVDGILRSRKNGEDKFGLIQDFAHAMMEHDERFGEKKGGPLGLGLLG